MDSVTTTTRPPRFPHFGRVLLFCVPLILGLTFPPKRSQAPATHNLNLELPWTVSRSDDTNLFEIPVSYYKPYFINKTISIKDILNDPSQRISQDFKIPKKLKPRVSFWFDIYTKYESQDYVIHHSEYPWIVFNVVNTKEIMNGKGHHWTKYHRAQRAVSQKARQIKRALRRLARKKSYKNLKGLEKRLYNKLKWVRGKRKLVFSFASTRVRSQRGQRDFFLSGLENSTKYLFYIEKEFKKQSLPLELTRLPFVESSFNESARSKVGASGIWQIMPATARDYARVTPYIDERNSPLKATRIAAKLLKLYKRQLKHWPLIVTAYNHGVGGMRKAVKKTKTNDLYTIIRRYKSKRLGFASKNFYTSFLAILYAEQYHYEIFSDEKIVKKTLLKREVVYLNRKMRSQTVLKTLGLSKKEFLLYNLDLKGALNRNTYLPKNFEFHLPAGHTTQKSNLVLTSPVKK